MRIIFTEEDNPGPNRYLVQLVPEDPVNCFQYVYVERIINGEGPPFGTFTYTFAYHEFHRTFHSRIELLNHAVQMIQMGSTDNEIRTPMVTADHGGNGSHFLN